MEAPANNYYKAIVDFVDRSGVTIEPFNDRNEKQARDAHASLQRKFPTARMIVCWKAQNYAFARQICAPEKRGR